MTKLFMKITNQLIESCKIAINGHDSPEKIWGKDPGPLSELLMKTLRCPHLFFPQNDVFKMHRCGGGEGGIGVAVTR